MTGAGTTLHSQILDSLQTLTIFVAFVTVLFGIRYVQISRGLQSELPGSNKPTARNDAKADLRRLFWSQCIPLVVLNAIPAYIFLPLTLSIMENSTVNIWHFDTLETGFFFLAVYLIFFSLWCIYLGLRIAWKGYQK